MNQYSEILIIGNVVENHFGLQEGDIQKNTRKEEIKFPRQVAMYFCRKLTRYSQATIGNQLGGKDHATVIHAKTVVENRIDTDKIFRQDIVEIEKKIKPALESILLLSDIFMLGFGVRKQGEKSIHTGKYFSFDVSCAVAQKNGFSSERIACFWSTTQLHVENCITSAYQEDIELMNNLLQNGRK